MTKKLYTSYFANWSIAEIDPGLLFVTTVFKAHWMPGTHFRELAPSSTLLSHYKAGRLSKESYKDQYLQILEGRGKSPQQIVDLLPQSAVLLCYEGRGQFCHRHIAAKWLSTADVVIEELR